MITVFGSINLDLIFAVPALPGPGQTVLGPAVRLDAGGKGANQAVAAARDGARVAMAGAVGRDVLAETALAGLVEAGVDTSRILRAEGGTGCAAVCTDPSGRNQIAVGSGANLVVRADQVEDALLGDGVVLLQMEVPAEETGALVRRGRGARFVLNLAPALPMDLEVLRAVDVVVVNEVEGAWLAGVLGIEAGAGALQARLGGAVVRTLGAAGAEFAGQDGAGFVAARRVAVVDTTAAGDCFIGVMAAGLDRGLGLGAALERAGVAAGLCCGRAGSQGSLPWREERICGGHVPLKH